MAMAEKLERATHHGILEKPRRSILRDPHSQVEPEKEMPGPPLNFLIQTNETACYSTYRLLLCVARTINMKIDAARQIEAPLNRRVDDRFNPY